MNNTCKIIDLEPIGEDEEPVNYPERICRKQISRMDEMYHPKRKDLTIGTSRGEWIDTLA